MCHVFYIWKKVSHLTFTDRECLIYLAEMPIITMLISFGAEITKNRINLGSSQINIARGTTNQALLL